jgi:hypothetical protein
MVWLLQFYYIDYGNNGVHLPAIFGVRLQEFFLLKLLFLGSLFRSLGVAWVVLGFED